MWFDGQRQPNTLYVASVSRGKDSTAMLRAIQLMGWPLDAICSVDIWFDDETPAELPPMVAFKDAWDAKCLEYFGVPVTRVCAMKDGKKLTYNDIFYRKVSVKRERDRESVRMAQRIEDIQIYGFPCRKGAWCNSKLKVEPMEIIEGQKINIVHYIGVAADEPFRIARHIPKKGIVMPLVQIGWDEDLCGLEATYMDMLSPTYDGSFRDGCWFCHNQPVGQLRNLRKNYPKLWQKLMKIDLDSPITFHADGHTVSDFDKRFQWEDDGFLPEGKQFRWAGIEEPQMNFWQMEEQWTS